MIAKTTAANYVNHLMSPLYIAIAIPRNKIMNIWGYINVDKWLTKCTLQ